MVACAPYLDEMDANPDFLSAGAAGFVPFTAAEYLSYLSDVAGGTASIASSDAPNGEAIMMSAHVFMAASPNDLTNARTADLALGDTANEAALFPVGGYTSIRESLLASLPAFDTSNFDAPQPTS